MTRRIDLPHAEMADAYRTGQSTVVLARRFGCSPTTVAKIVRAHGGTMRPARFRPSTVAEAALREQYLVQRLPVAQIAANFGISPSTVGNKRRLYGIAVRSRQAPS